MAEWNVVNVNEADVGELAATWIKLQKAPRDSRQARRDRLDAYFWSFEKLGDLIQKDPDAVWEVIQKIRDLDSTDLILANLAAGPVEDLLVYHGERFIDRVVVRARRDPVFRKLLGAVWRNEIPESVWKKLRAIAGPTF